MFCVLSQLAKPIQVKLIKDQDGILLLNLLLIQMWYMTNFDE